MHNNSGDARKDVFAWRRSGGGQDEAVGGKGSKDDEPKNAGEKEANENINQQFMANITFNRT